jgi:hypothetical protein
VSASTVPYCSSTKPWDLDEFAVLAVPTNFAAIVLGFAPDFSYRHLCYATAVLRETGSCTLVATNPDSGDRIAEGRIMPGTGCLVAALEVAAGMQAVCTSACQPLVSANLRRSTACSASASTEACVVLGAA